MKDKFFSILAHDLKNPFTNLHSLSDLIIRNYTELEESDKLMALQNINKPGGTAGETGTGPGLVLCSEFVTKNASRFCCKSVQGKGSPFLFAIPAAN